MRGRKSSKCRDVIICDETISNESEAFQYLLKRCMWYETDSSSFKNVYKSFSTRNNKEFMKNFVSQGRYRYKSKTWWYTIHITHGWTQDENQAIHVTDPYFLIHIHSWRMVLPVSSKKSRGQKERLFAVCTGIFWPFESTRNQIKSTVLTKRCVCIR